jgi:formylglycine-generating enzyme required for sulfatase activity
MGSARRAQAALVAIALLAASVCRAEDATPAGMVRVPGGTYLPFYPVKDEAPTPVAPFLLDALPITNAQYLDFVRAQPQWRRSQVSPLFAESAYLSSWAGDLEPGSGAPLDAPVTFVSWFAADAYCRAQAKRLPSEAEWEFAAAPPSEDAAAKAETERRILAFYARPRGPLPRVGSTPPNAYGLRDLHGVIWEWVEDFNASLAAADNRSDRDRALDNICGGSAVGAADTTHYATFMRIAFRSSLQATYALHHLGFRCARSLP